MSIEVVNNLRTIKVSELPEMTHKRLSSDDYFYVIDDLVSKKIKFSELLLSIDLYGGSSDYNLSIDNVIPSSPSDNRVPSTKLFSDELTKINNQLIGFSRDYLTKSHADSLYELKGTASELVSGLNSEVSSSPDKFITGITQVRGKITSITESEIPDSGSRVSVEPLIDSGTDIATIIIDGESKTIKSPNNSYSLPPATDHELGGVIVGDNLTIDDGKLSVDDNLINKIDSKVSNSTTIAGLPLSNNITSESLLNALDISSSGSSGSSIATPIGTIIPWMGLNDTSRFPDGFLLCDGRAVSRSEYSELFEVIGDKFGSGDGSTTFNLPQLTDGRYLRGSTEVNGTLVPAGLPNITGTLPTTPYSSSLSGAFIDIGDLGSYAVSGSAGSGVKTQFNASKSNSIYGKSSTVTPKSLDVLYLICYKVINVTTSDKDDPTIDSDKLEELVDGLINNSSHVTELNNKITNNTTAITNEVTRATGVETQLRTDLTQESTNRVEQDHILQDNIDKVGNMIPKVDPVYGVSSPHGTNYRYDDSSLSNRVDYLTNKLLTKSDKNSYMGCITFNTNLAGNEIVLNDYFDIEWGKEYLCQVRLLNYSSTIYKPTVTFPSDSETSYPYNSLASKFANVTDDSGTYNYICYSSSIIKLPNASVVIDNKSPNVFVIIKLWDFTNRTIDGSTFGRVRKGSAGVVDENYHLNRISARQFNSCLSIDSDSVITYGDSNRLYGDIIINNSFGSSIVSRTNITNLVINHGNYTNASGEYYNAFSRCEVLKSVIVNGFKNLEAFTRNGEIYYSKSPFEIAFIGCPSLEVVRFPDLVSLYTNDTNRLSYFMYRAFYNNTQPIVVELPALSHSESYVSKNQEYIYNRWELPVGSTIIFKDDVITI